jgi:hypothetical protein
MICIANCINLSLLMPQEVNIEIRDTMVLLLVLLLCEFGLQKGHRLGVSEKGELMRMLVGNDRRLEMIT